MLDPVTSFTHVFIIKPENQWFKMDSSQILLRQYHLWGLKSGAAGLNASGKEYFVHSLHEVKNISQLQPNKYQVYISRFYNHSRNIYYINIAMKNT